MLYKKWTKRTHSTTKISFIYLKKNDIKLKFQRLYFYDKFQCAMNQTNMNIESAYSIINALVSESKKYVITSRLDIEKNNENRICFKKCNF